MASHHGGNDASSYPFIKSVNPDYVLFSAGSHNRYGHPRAAVAKRFLDSGIQLENMFRTDLGDDESRADHWENESTIQGTSDESGDDDIMIRLTKDGDVVVKYVDQTYTRCEADGI